MGTRGSTAVLVVIVELVDVDMAEVEDVESCVRDDGSNRAGGLEGCSEMKGKGMVGE